NSGLDNPRYLSVMIGDWLNSWKDRAKASKSYADAPRLSLTNRGQYIFATQCAACHSIGQGDRIGPDLLGVTKIRDRAWPVRPIAASEKLLADDDPIATALYEQYNQVNMPNLRLADADVHAVVQYLEIRSTEGQDAASPETQAMKTRAAVAPATHKR